MGSKKGEGRRWITLRNLQELPRAREKGVIGWKHNKPPQNYSHKYNVSIIKFFGNVWKNILDYFSLF
jgi:hypothetical protein